MDKCSKCFQPIDKVEIRSHWGEAYKFCPLCSKTLDAINQTGIIEEFMLDDFGYLPVPAVVKYAIKARIKRVEGNSPWTKTKNIV